MRNTSCVNELYKCSFCNLKGFFCYTPDGADFNTCPCCGTRDFLNWQTYLSRLKNDETKYYSLSCSGDDDDMRLEFNYCNKCKILFKVGCMHYVGGCTDNIFNCHFIKKWKHKKTDIVHNGMPLFDDEDDWFNNANDVIVLQMYCPHKSSLCSSQFNNIDCFHSNNCDLKE